LPCSDLTCLPCTDPPADEILAMPPGRLVAVCLPDCLAAVNASAVETLVVSGDGCDYRAARHRTR
jgi:hypothetical protein